MNEARALVEEAFLLRYCAGYDPDYDRTHWSEWDRKAERYLRGCTADCLANKIAHLAFLWGGGTAAGMAEAGRILATSPVLEPA
jgi:hypothetical protein